MLGYSKSGLMQHGVTKGKGPYVKEAMYIIGNL